MNMVIVVELPASDGIFSKALLVMIKRSLAKKANPAPKMKCQLKIICKMLEGVKLLPEIKERDPVRSMDITVASENSMVYRMT